MILIACWTQDQDPSVEHPKSVRWADGRKATLDDYQRHMLDTHKLIYDGTGLMELHMFPNIVAEVSYDLQAKAWMVSGRGVIPQMLDITDPQAEDDQIIAELYSFPVVYRAIIKRTS